MVPPARSGHSALVVDNKMVVFGGIFDITRELNDTCVFDLTKNTWKVLQFEKELEDISPSKTFMGFGISPLIKKSSLKKSTDKSNIPYFLAKSGTENPTIPRPGLTINTAATADKKVVEKVELKSPASLEMKNSFIIKNSDPSFDTYANAMRRKKGNGGLSNVGGTIFGLSLPTGQKGVSRQAGKRPAPRDGHTGVLFGDYMVIFGGDRHHMPFNDLLILDLATELSS